MKLDPKITHTTEKQLTAQNQALFEDIVQAVLNLTVLSQKAEELGQESVLEYINDAGNALTTALPILQPPTEEQKEQARLMQKHLDSLIAQEENDG